MSELHESPPRPEPLPQAPHHAAWQRAFEERYGQGAHARLIAAFANTRVSYADIASQFGVTRERVRQWHHELYPDAPRGHDRRRSRSIYNRKRKLLQDPLFRAFVRAARGSLAPGEIVPVTARDGFRKRLVKLGERTVLLRRASRARSIDAGSARRVYSLSGSRGAAEFIFFLLEGHDFLFVPLTIVPPGGTTYTDVEASPYRAFKNAFAPALGATDTR